MSVQPSHPAGHRDVAPDLRRSRGRGKGFACSTAKIAVFALSVRLYKYMLDGLSEMIRLTELQCEDTDENETY